MGIFRNLCLCAALAVLSLNVFAEIRVNYDCNMREGYLDCATISQAFFESITFLENVTEATEEQSANVAFTLRTFPINEGTRYLLRAVGSGDFEGLENSARIDIYNSEHDRLLDKLLNLHQRMILMFAKADGNIQTDENGQVQVNYSNPNPSQNFNPTRSEPWYLQLTLGGHYVHEQTVGGYGSGGFNYSTDTWRIKVDGSFSYTRILAQLGPGQENENMKAEGDVVISYTFEKNWNIAVIGAVKHSPQNDNLTISSVGALALEWLLVPFRTNNDFNIGANYALGFVYLNFDQVNYLGEEEAMYVNHTLQGFVRWHINNSADLTGGVRLTTQIHNFDYFNVSGFAKIDWRIVPEVSISLYGDISYRTGIVNQPAIFDPDTLTIVNNGDNFANLNSTIYLTLTFRFGNPNYQDQRWTTEPDLLP